MRTISIDDLKIFEKSESLNEEYLTAEKRWLYEVKKVNQGLITYDETRDTFDKYVGAQAEWKKYFDDHIHILLMDRI
ncbi:MAG: hypothetical protein WAW86_10600 [Gammaproteobacteria bacterium]